MKINRSIPFLLVLIMSCHSPAISPAPLPLTSVDTTKANFQSGPDLKNNSVAALKTHLTDTTYAGGSFILFLQPDDARYEELEKEPDEGAGEGDSDFGAGISGTQDSLKINDRYKNIRVLTSGKRYICIKDCKDGPLIIDRDTVSYGFILSAKGRPIAATYNAVHSGNYLGELDKYFSLH
jgi:hypothetical protein